MRPSQRAPGSKRQVLSHTGPFSLDCLVARNISLQLPKPTRLLWRCEPLPPAESLCLWQGVAHEGVVFAAPFAQETEWAEYEKKKVSGRMQEVPVDDACKNCKQFYLKTCGGWMSWAKYIDLCAKSQEFKDEIEKGMARQNAGERALDYVPMQVSSAASYGVEIATHGLALDGQDVIDISGGKTPEDLRLKMQAVTDSHGKVHKVFLARDPHQPYRTFRAFSRFDDSSMKVHLEPKEQLFTSQGNRLLEALRSGRAEGKTEQKNFFSCKPCKLPTLEELKEKWQRGDQYVDSDGELDADEDGPAASQAGQRVSRVSAGSVSVFQDSGKKPKLQRAGSGGQLERKDGDGGSVMGQDDTVGAYALPASHWLAVIKITEMLDGTRFGKQVGFATKLLARLDEANKVVAAKSLRKHLKVANIALTLSSSNISSMPKEELEGALGTLKEYGVDFPSNMKALVLQAKCQDIAAQASQRGWNDPGLCARLSEALRMWQLEHDVLGFDPLEPKLVDLEGGPMDHAATYLSIFWTGQVLPLVIEGEAKQHEVLALVTNFMTIYEGLPYALDPQVEDVMSEIVTSLRCLRALLDTSYLDEDAGDDVAAVFNEKRKKGKQHGAMFLLKEALADNHFYETQELYLGVWGSACFSRGQK